VAPLQAYGAELSRCPRHQADFGIPCRRSTLSDVPPCAEDLFVYRGPPSDPSAKLDLRMTQLVQSLNAQPRPSVLRQTAVIVLPIQQQNFPSLVPLCIIVPGRPGAALAIRSLKN
jgi:hypothetical protein